MNAQEFISSGILETYVMGGATDAEREQVLAMIKQYPEVKAELETIEDAMNSFAMRYAVEPPTHLKEKVLSKIASTAKDTSANSSSRKEFRIGPEAETLVTPKRSNNVYAIAASVALLISLPLNIYLYSKVSTSESKVTAMADEQQKLSSAMHDSLVAYQGMRNELYVLTDPMFKRVDLAGLKASPDSKAMVCWCPDSKEVYFKTEKLPNAPKGMQYELWAIVDGKPVAAGMIDTTGQGMQKMKLIANATAFAVTLEKEGGSDAPHGDMYVMGAI